MLDALEKNATAVRLSSDPDRRSRGLALLRQAAEMTPGPGLGLKLRDQALSFLTMRDVEGQAPIPTPDRPQHGLIFSPDGKKIATLSDAGELGIWDVQARELVDSTRLPVAPSRLRSPQGANRGGGGMIPMTSRIAPSGEQVAIVRPDGGGLRLFNIDAPNTPADPLTLNDVVIGSLVATPDGRHFATITRPASAPEGRGR